MSTAVAHGAAVVLDIVLPASLVPEAISNAATEVPVQVTVINEVTGDIPFDNTVIFARDGTSFTTAEGISFAPISTSWETDTYKVRVKGPLHLSQVATGVALAAEGSTLIDFSSGGVEAMLGGDLDTNGLSANRVDMADVGVLLQNYDTNSPAADINIDGKVDIVDVGFIIKNWDRTGEE